MVARRHRRRGIRALRRRHAVAAGSSARQRGARIMRSRFAIMAVPAAAALAALAPLLARPSASAVAEAGHFPGWPTHYEGRVLTELPLTQRELAFVRDFPGRVGRFSDGRREIIIRWVGAPTRRLHPASDCFRGSGYSITPMPLGKDAAGAAMGCFRANHDADGLTVF